LVTLPIAMSSSVTCGSFVLMVAGELPGDSEVEKPYSLQAVYNWLQDLPEQIERAAINGG
jgi:hypothetical protein